MKKQLFTIAAAVFALGVTSAVAQGLNNEAYVYQANMTQKAYIEQTGNNNEALQRQYNKNNTASIDQYGNMNDAYQMQNGINNDAGNGVSAGGSAIANPNENLPTGKTILEGSTGSTPGIDEIGGGNVTSGIAQSGNLNGATQLQVGNNNKAGIMQLGDRNYARQEQNGNRNESSTWQYGDRNDGRTLQNGDSNKARIRQAGDGYVTPGNNHTALIDQLGNSNKGVIDQRGTGHNSTIIQN